MPMEPILNVKNLTMKFGGLKALDDVSITIEKGQITALIGPNGAGKPRFSTVLPVSMTPPGVKYRLRLPENPPRASKDSSPIM